MDTDLKITIAVISASSAILGAVIAQLVSILRDILDKRHQRHKLLREKYEELARYITDSQNWFMEQIGAMSLRELKGKPPVAARNAMVLAHIYFPALRESCQDYVNACANFQVTLINSHDFTEGKDAGTQAVHRDRDTFERAANQLHLARQRVDEEVIKYATRYTKA